MRASHKWIRTVPAMFVCAIGATGHGPPWPARRPGRSGHAAPEVVLATRRAAWELDRWDAQAPGTSFPQDCTARTATALGAPECAARRQRWRSRRRDG